MLFTQKSRLNESFGSPIAGLVRLRVDGFVLRPVSFAGYEGGGFGITVMDCAFSQNGDFFLTWQDIFDEVAKVRPNKQADHFARLETSFGGEITVKPGVLKEGLKAEWFDPRNGRRTAARANEDNSFATPDKQDWLLLLH